MKRTTTTCDDCGKEVKQFGGRIDVQGYGSVVLDACSPACLASMMRKKADEIEKKNGVVDVFAVLPTKACGCPVEHWKATPADSSTPGKRQVECSKCGAKWQAEVHDMAQALGDQYQPTDGGFKRGTMTPEEVKAQNDPPRRRGRPPGSKNGAATSAPAAPAPDAPAPAIPAAQDRARVVEGPQWCSCGRPLVLNGQAWACGAPVEEGCGMSGLLEVRGGLPGEDLFKLHKDAIRVGVELGSADGSRGVNELATWPVIQRDVLREWIRAGARADERPHFLPPPPLPTPTVPAGGEFAF